MKKVIGARVELDARDTVGLTPRLQKELAIRMGIEKIFNEVMHDEKLYTSVMSRNPNNGKDVYTFSVMINYED